MDRIRQLQINLTQTEYLALQNVKNQNGKMSWRNWLLTFVQ